MLPQNFCSSGRRCSRNIYLYIERERLRKGEPLSMGQQSDHPPSLPPALVIIITCLATCKHSNTQQNSSSWCVSTCKLFVIDEVVDGLQALRLAIGFTCICSIYLHLEWSLTSTFLWYINISSRSGPLTLCNGLSYHN